MLARRSAERLHHSVDLLGQMFGGREILIDDLENPLGECQQLVDAASRAMRGSGDLGVSVRLDRGAVLRATDNTATMAITVAIHLLSMLVMMHEQSSDGVIVNAAQPS